MTRELKVLLVFLDFHDCQLFSREQIRKVKLTSVKCNVCFASSEWWKRGHLWTWTQVPGNKTDKMRLNLFSFCSRQWGGWGGRQDAWGRTPCGLLAVLHSYAHDPGLCSNRQMSAKSPCPGVGDRTLVRWSKGESVWPCPLLELLPMLKLWIKPD